MSSMSEYWLLLLLSRVPLWGCIVWGRLGRSSLVSCTRRCCRHVCVNFGFFTQEPHLGRSSSLSVRWVGQGPPGGEAIRLLVPGIQTFPWGLVKVLSWSRRRGGPGILHLNNPPGDSNAARSHFE